MALYNAATMESRREIRVDRGIVEDTEEPGIKNRNISSMDTNNIINKPNNKLNISECSLDLEPNDILNSATFAKGITNNSSFISDLLKTERNQLHVHNISNTDSDGAIRGSCDDKGKYCNRRHEGYTDSDDSIVSNDSYLSHVLSINNENTSSSKRRPRGFRLRNPIPPVSRPRLPPITTSPLISSLRHKRHILEKQCATFLPKKSELMRNNMSSNQSRRRHREQTSSTPQPSLISPSPHSKSPIEKSPSESLSWHPIPQKVHDPFITSSSGPHYSPSKGVPSQNLRTNISPSPTVEELHIKLASPTATVSSLRHYFQQCASLSHSFAQKDRTGCCALHVLSQNVALLESCLAYSEGTFVDDEINKNGIDEGGEAIRKLVIDMHTVYPFAIVEVDKEGRIPFTSILDKWVEWLFQGTEDGGTISTPNNPELDEKRTAPSTPTLEHRKLERSPSSYSIVSTRSMVRSLAESNYFFDTYSGDCLIKKTPSKGFLGLGLQSTYNRGALNIKKRGRQKGQVDEFMRRVSSKEISRNDSFPISESASFITPLSGKEGDSSYIRQCDDDVETGHKMARTDSSNIVMNIIPTNVYIPPLVEWTLITLDALWSRLLCNTSTKAAMRIVKTLASIHGLIPVLLLLVDNPSNSKILRLSLVTSVMRSPFGIGEWTIRMLESSKEQVARKAVYYLEWICSSRSSDFFKDNRVINQHHLHYNSCYDGNYHHEYHNNQLGKGDNEIDILHNCHRPIVSTQRAALLPYLLPAALALEHSYDAARAASLLAVRAAVDNELTGLYTVLIVFVDLILNILVAGVTIYLVLYETAVLSVAASPPLFLKRILLFAILHGIIRRIGAMVMLVKVSKDALRDYCGRLTDWADWLGLGMALTTVIITERQGDSDDVNDGEHVPLSQGELIFLAFVVLTQWLRCLSLLYVINWKFARFCQTMWKVFLDLRWIIFLLLIAIFSFAQLLIILLSNKSLCDDDNKKNHLAICGPDKIHFWVYAAALGQFHYNDFFQERHGGGEGSAIIPVLVLLILICFTGAVFSYAATAIAVKSYSHFSSTFDNKHGHHARLMYALDTRSLRNVFTIGLCSPHYMTKILFAALILVYFAIIFIFSKGKTWSTLTDTFGVIPASVLVAVLALFLLISSIGFFSYADFREENDITEYTGKVKKQANRETVARFLMWPIYFVVKKSVGAVEVDGDNSNILILGEEEYSSSEAWKEEQNEAKEKSFASSFREYIDRENMLDSNNHRVHFHTENKEKNASDSDISYNDSGVIEYSIAYYGPNGPDKKSSNTHD